MACFLYIHIPFCIQKCIYCDFYSVPDSMHRVDEYIDALCKEIELKRDAIDILDTVYIGGGTPSILEEKHFAQIMAAIKDGCLFSDGAEITTESNPGTLTDARIKAMLDSGINRLSIGIQSFNDKELALLGRMHSSEEALSAVNSARRGGFGNISIDLIYGLPGQAVDDWKASIEAAIDLRPEHISAYELTPEEKTPLFHMLETGELVMPDEDIIAQMYYATIDTMGENGYEHYEISNFALPGRRCRHNVNYWNRGEYLGIGASAHSFIGGRRISNIADVDGYISSVTNNAPAIDEDTVMSDMDALEETIFLGLRKTEGFDTRLVPSEQMDRMKKALRDMSQQGLVEISGNMLSLTRKGLMLCNEVIVRLMLCID